MKLRLLAVLSVLLLSISSCSDDAAKEDEPLKEGLLSTELVKNPQSAGGANPVALELMPRLTFDDTLHDFGTLHAGEKVMYEFAFTNTGKTPLIISGATTSCGCTVADYPREPIAPGASGKMKVVFDSANKEGHVEKTVAINANTARGIHALKITAEVKEK